MNDHNLALLTVGEVLAAFVPDAGKAFRRAHSLHRFTVGAEANVAVAVSRLGLPSTCISRVGSDLLGEAILDDLRQEGVNVSAVHVDPSAFTGSLMRETPAPGSTRVTYRRSGSAGSQLSRSQISRELIQAHSHVHVSGVTAALGPEPLDTIRALFDEAHSLGRVRSFDMNYRSQLWSPEDAGPVLRECAEMADIVIGGRTEWEIAFGSEEAGVAALDDQTLAVVTDGAREIRSYRGNEQLTQTPFPSQVVDPVGAGDGFVGGLLAGLMAGLDTSGAIRQGAYCGSRVVAELGDWAGLPFGVGGTVNIPEDDGAVQR